MKQKTNINKVERSHKGDVQGPRRKVSLWQLFLTFAKVGAFTIGGGYAMVMVIKNEVVGKGWVSEEEFPDILALSQAAPGLLAVNISIFIGYRLRGTKGSIVATIGGILPPFLIILLIAMVFSGFQDNPVVVRIFKGIRPVVVALIAVPMLQMAKTSNTDWRKWLVTAAALVLVAFLKVSPIYILLTVIVLALSLTLMNDRKTKMQNLRSIVEDKNAAEGQQKAGESVAANEGDVDGEGIVADGGVAADDGVAAAGGAAADGGVTDDDCVSDDVEKEGEK